MKEFVINNTTPRELRRCEFPPVSEHQEEVADVESRQEEEIFEVEEILGHSFLEGDFKFLVKWKGYPISECTWEPHSNLDNAQSILKRYTERLA